MKISVVIFSVIFLINSNYSFSQTNKLFNSLEEAKSVHKDSVFQLDLTKSKLKELPLEVLDFKNLHTLYLGKNKLTKLPENFHTLNQLQILDLSKNNFSTFPSMLCGMTSITQLFLGKNQINKLPHCIGQMENLEILDIWLNELSGVPNSISNLRKLKSLDVRGINLSSETLAYIQALIPWAKVESNKGCDCGF